MAAAVASAQATQIAVATAAPNPLAPGPGFAYQNASKGRTEKGLPTMLRLLWTAPAMLIALSATPAAAAWLQCAASGSNPSGKVAYETTIADIGAVSPQRMDALKHRLLDHIMKSDPDAKSIAVNCTISDDQLAATTQYDRLLNATVRHLGWEHVRVLAPTEWLADTDIVENPSAE